jgi:hypothetical protein
MTASRRLMDVTGDKPELREAPTLLVTVATPSKSSDRHLIV